MTGASVEAVRDPADDRLWVKSVTSPQALAGSIRYAIFQERKMPVIRAIGAGAVAQACKGIAIARGYVATQGHDLGCSIGFDTVTGDEGKEISAQTFHLYFR